MNDLRVTRAEGFPFQGHLLTGELVTGLLVLRYDRQQVEGFLLPIGAGMTRWCELRIEGTAPLNPNSFTATVVSERLGEQTQIQIIPERTFVHDGFWVCEGRYMLQNRWRLPGAGLGIQDLPGES